jgi:hypothetical protein
MPQPICMWCGGTHSARCPLVKAMDFFLDGKLKRVEFWSAHELPQQGTVDEPDYERLSPSQE